jgi:hypothetical protein
MSDSDIVIFNQGDAQRIVKAVKWVESQPPLRKQAAGMVGTRQRGSGSAPRIFVALSNPTGAAGGPGVACNYHYDVHKIDGGDPIASNVAMTGPGQRVVIGPTYSPGSIGSGYYAADGTFVLVWANETFTGMVCPETP